MEDYILLEKNMYVRCPVDYEDRKNPRTFLVGLITEVNEFAKVVKVKFCDPFGYRLMYGEKLEEDTFRIDSVERCSMFKDSYVEYNDEKYKVIESEKKEDWHYYYIQNTDTKKICKVREDALMVPFTNGHVQPYKQLMNYEFQNPCWYLGRNVVSKTMHTLEHSFYGFKELAGCKMFLFPHQLKTIMRCMENKKCRVLLADEVGMGKTIEALSVLKVYLSNNIAKRVLIAVPKALLEQWNTEMFFKFDMSEGIDQAHNQIFIKAIEDITKEDNRQKWDFMVVDEVHKLLNKENKYDVFHELSKNSANVILLSATPVQQKQNEYLKLVRLILPEKYDSVSAEEFNVLVEKQKVITKAACVVLLDFEDYQDLVQQVIEDGENPAEDKDCQDLYDHIRIKVNKLVGKLNDNVFQMMAEKMDINSDDYSIATIQELMAYVCDYYQIERNIIRNRRKSISEELPKRMLHKREYILDPDRNTYEYATYEAIVKWVENKEIDKKTFKNYYIPLLEAFFSSAWAFQDKIRFLELLDFEVDTTVKAQAKLWLNQEQLIIDNIKIALEDPEQYQNRIVSVLDYILEWAYEKKVVVFTNHNRTFDVYRKVFEKYFNEQQIAFFQKGMSSDELELHSYRFQNDQNCKIMLCDETGGEGRNFQCADEVLHIDLPWDANAIEQRIGRLDRLGRDAARDVTSVVFYLTETLEEELLNFWDKGLGIFKHSLSGLEIIMGDINEQIINAVTEDFRYGLTTAVERVIELSKSMESEIREQQHYDTAGYIYSVINQQMNRVIRQYHENENQLFASTMMSWASLVGLKPSKNVDGCISFKDSCFSMNSAKNAMLIPPNWEEYMGKKQNVFAAKIHELYANKVKRTNVSGRTIRGTFDRKNAIENDYLHFFSPGDEIFDCIVNNALQSCRGQVAAYAVKTPIEWKGLVFTYSIEPDVKLLLDQNVPLAVLGEFRNYLAVEQITVLAPISKYIDVPKQEVLDALNWISKLPVSVQRKELVHLGKRKEEKDFLHIKNRFGMSNINWFKKNYPEENWKAYVKQSVKKTREEAAECLRKKSSIKVAQNEMNRRLCSMKAAENYYGKSTGDYAETKRQYEVVLRALGRPNLVMESASFVWMVKE